MTRSGNYFISVVHAEDGRGYYRLTVSHNNPQLEFEKTAAERQSRRGGFVGYPLFLLLLLAMIAWYRTRAGLQVRRHRL